MAAAATNKEHPLVFTATATEEYLKNTANMENDIRVAKNFGEIAMEELNKLFKEAHSKWAGNGSVEKTSAFEKIAIQVKPKLYKFDEMTQKEFDAIKSGKGYSAEFKVFISSYPDLKTLNAEIHENRQKLFMYLYNMLANPAALGFDEYSPVNIVKNGKIPKLDKKALALLAPQQQEAYAAWEKLTSGKKPALVVTYTDGKPSFEIGDIGKLNTLMSLKAGVLRVKGGILEEALSQGDFRAIRFDMSNCVTLTIRDTKKEETKFDANTKEIVVPLEVQQKVSCNEQQNKTDFRGSVKYRVYDSSGIEVTETKLEDLGNGKYNVRFIPEAGKKYYVAAAALHEGGELNSGVVRRAVELGAKAKTRTIQPVIKLERDQEPSTMPTGLTGTYFGGLQLDSMSRTAYGGNEKLNLLWTGDSAIQRAANINSLQSWLYGDGSNYRSAWVNLFVGANEQQKEANLKKFFSLAASGQAKEAYELLDKNSPFANGILNYTDIVTSFKDLNEMLKTFENKKNTAKLSLDLELFRSPYALTKVYLVYHHTDLRFYLTGDQGMQSLSMDAGNITALQSFNLKGDKTVEVNDPNSLDPKDLDKFHANLFLTGGLSFASIRSGSVLNIMPSDRTYWGFNSSIGTMLTWDLSDDSAVRLLNEVGWERFLDKRAGQRSDNFSLDLHLKYQLNKNISLGFGSRLSQIQVMSKEQPDWNPNITPLSVRRTTALKPTIGLNNMFGLQSLNLEAGPTVTFTQGGRRSLGFDVGLRFSPSDLFRGKAGYEYETNR